MNKVLFIGNGLNTLDSQNNNFSWNDILISKMSPKDKKHFVDSEGKIIKELSPTFIFDAVQNQWQ